MAGWYLISRGSTLHYDCPLEMQSALRSQCTERLERTQRLAERCPFVLLLEGAETLWLPAVKRLCLNISREASPSPVLLLLWHCGDSCSLEQEQAPNFGRSGAALDFVSSCFCRARANTGMSSAAHR